jgi:hypothetical protein
MADLAARNQEISRRLNRMLPDNPSQAIAAVALCYANVAVATGLDDESAIDALRIALRQMRDGMPESLTHPGRGAPTS